MELTEGYSHIIDFMELYMGKRKHLSHLLIRLRENPYILDTYMGELNCAIHLFNHYKRDGKIISKYKDLLMNAQVLKDALGQMDLPDGNEVIRELMQDSFAVTVHKLKKVSIEFDQFLFINQKTRDYLFLGRILLALYRTYILQNMADLREKGVQIASTVEEMLAILALEDFDTHLFQATKHWIMDWKGEGFSKELAKKIGKL